MFVTFDRVIDNRYLVLSSAAKTNKITLTDTITALVVIVSLSIRKSQISNLVCHISYHARSAKSNSWNPFKFDTVPFHLRNRYACPRVFGKVLQHFCSKADL